MSTKPKKQRGCLLTIGYVALIFFITTTLVAFFESQSDFIITVGFILMCYFLLTYFATWIAKLTGIAAASGMFDSDPGEDESPDAVIQLREEYHHKNPFINDNEDQQARIERRRNAATSKWVPPSDVLAENEYVAVDFEAANKTPLSACAIALVRFKDGESVDTFFSYIHPPAGFENFIFTDLHGIDADDIKDAPNWKELSDKIAAFVGNSTVYAHNASYDGKVWAELDSYYETTTYPKQFYCSYRLAVKVLPDLENHRLPTVLAACSPETKLDHHDALSDANACGVIIWSLRAKSGL